MFKPQTKAVAMPVLNKMYPYMVAISLMCLATSSAGAQVAVKKNADDSMSLQSGGAEQVRVMTDGKVGVNTIAPAVALDVSGSLMIANGGEVCDASTEGALRYTLANGVEYCNSSAWGGVGTGLWTDNTSYISYEGVNFYKEGSVPSGYSNGDKAFVWHPDKRALAIGKASYAGMFNDSSMGDVSFAFGDSAIASGNGSFAFGINARSTGTRSISFGGSASANYAIALQGNAESQDAFSVARYGGAYGTRSIAIGSSGALNGGAQSYGLSSVAIGTGSDAYANYGVAIGTGSSVSGTSAVAFTAARADGLNSIAMGKNAFVSGSNSMVFGLADVTGTEVTDSNTMAILGGQVAVNQVSANAELDVLGTVSATAFVGDGASITGISGLWSDDGEYISYGGVNGFRIYDASSTVSVSNLEKFAFYDPEKRAMRGGTNAASDWDDANLGEDSFVWGSSSRAYGDSAVALGGNFARADGDKSVAFGTVSMATGIGSVAIGTGTNGSGINSTTLGDRTESTARGAVAIARSRASSDYAVAIGNASAADGIHSFAIGRKAEVSANDSMVLAVGDGNESNPVTTTNTIALMGATSGVGIGTIAPSAELEVSGTVSATAFVGDGASLTGVVATMGLNDLTDAVRNSESIYIGLNAGDNHNPAAQQNVAIGEYAMANAPSADANVAIGYKALGYANGKVNNISIGKHSSRYIQGNENITIGRDAGYGQSSADVNRNIFIGKESGFSVDTGANDNTFLGHRSGYAVSTGANNILIGSGVETSAPTSSNELNIGNTLYGDLTNDRIGVGITAPAAELDVSGSIQYTGDLTDVSDRRLKQNIQPLEGELDKVSQVQAVSFEMKDRPGVVELGVIAQDIEEIYPELVKTADDDMQTKSVNYVGLIAPMLQAMRELKAEVETLKIQNAQQKVQIDQLMEKTNQ